MVSVAGVHPTAPLIEKTASVSGTLKTTGGSPTIVLAVVSLEAPVIRISVCCG